MKAWWAQTRAEIFMSFRRGESLLLLIGIPVGLLVFFTETRVIRIHDPHPINVLAPGVLALSIMSSSFVLLSIATGFERSYGVLRRLTVTPLGRTRYLLAKVAATIVTEVVQVVIVSLVGLALGWNPHGGLLGAVAIIGVVLLATTSFVSVGFVLAGTLRAEANLAASNGLYIVLLLMSGFIIPASELPHAVAQAVIGLPSGALGSAMHRVLGSGTGVGTGNLVSLCAWAIGAPALARRVFRFS